MDAPSSDVWLVARDGAEGHLANVSREARSLLGALEANVQWLRSGIGEKATTDGVAEGLTDIETCCERLAELLEDAVLAVRSDPTSIQCLTVSLGSLVSAAQKLVRRRAEAKGISIEIESSVEVAATLDRTLVTRALGKLLARLVDDVPPESRLTIRYGIYKNDLLIDFDHDQAPDSGRPSDPSRRASGPTSSGFLRAVQDLDFCRRVAEAHGGALVIRASAPVYRMVLPATPDSAAG